MIDRDEAIQYAKEAGFTGIIRPDFYCTEEQLQSLLNQVRNEALEEAAQLCDEIQKNESTGIVAHKCGGAIRALKDPMEPKSK